MNKLQKALNLTEDVSEKEANELALEIMKSKHSQTEEDIHLVADALINIGKYRLTGAGYSKEISDSIIAWAEKYFEEENKKVAYKITDVLYELTSPKAKETILKFAREVKDRNLEENLMDTYAYGGT